MHQHNTNWTFGVASNAHTMGCCQEKWRDLRHYSGMLLLTLYLTKCTRNIYDWVSGKQNKTAFNDLYLRFVQESYILGNNGSLLAGRERGARSKHTLTSMLFGCFRPKCAPPRGQFTSKENPIIKFLWLCLSPGVFMSWVAYFGECKVIVLPFNKGYHCHIQTYIIIMNVCSTFSPWTDVIDSPLVVDISIWSRWASVALCTSLIEGWVLA